MNFARVSINSLVFDPDNARSHSKDNIEAIKNSLFEFGQYLPIVVRKSNNVVLVGNGTLRAAIDLGWKEIMVVYVDVDDIQADTLSVIDNRSSELSYFDDEVINKFFYEVDEVSQKVTGFTDNEIIEIMNKLDLGSQDDLTEKINIPNVKCPYCNYEWRNEKIKKKGKK